MPFVAVGVEHKTAPVEIREQVTIADDAWAAMNARLLAEPSIDEVALLSTCNRTEIYVFGSDVDELVSRVTLTLTRGNDLLTPYVQTWHERGVVEHLFRVSAGIESQVLGENQILSQVRDVLDTGQHLGTIGPNLHALFRSAISCARQARAGAALGRVNASVGSEAVCRAEQALGSLHGRGALLVGGGEITRLVAEQLVARHASPLFVANRTIETAIALAHHFGGTPATLEDIPRLIPHVDLVICATSAPRYVLTPESMPSDVSSERTQALRIFDLAIPRDVDPSVGAMNGIELHDLDSLIPSEMQDRWESDVEQMAAIISAEVPEFMAWYLTRRVAPVISNLRSHVERVAETELRRVGPQLADLSLREREAVESLTNRLIDKMFHHLVLRLRLAAQTDESLVKAAEFFFLHGDGGLFAHAAEESAREENEVKST
jgi:glutamyl-tRNA reductase